MRGPRRLLGILLAGLVAACGKGDAPPPAPDVVAPADVASPHGVSPELRADILALAVASECLRKDGTPHEQMATTMLSLYRAHNIDLETYTREMTKLASDPTFTAEIEAKVRACPERLAAAPDAAAAPDTAVPPDTAVAPDTAAAPDTAVAPDTAAAPDTNPPPDTTPPPDTRPAVDTALAEPGPSDVREPPPDADKPDKPEAPRYAGTWTGALSGNQTGQLRVTVAGRTVTSAVATFGRTTLRLKGSLSEGGALTLAGTQGDSFLRVNGTLDKGGKSISGKWSGVVERKRSDGRFRLVR